MRSLCLSVFTFFIFNYAHGQYLEPDELTIVRNNIKEYKIIQKDSKDKYAEFNNKLVKHLKLGQLANVEYKYTFYKHNYGNTQVTCIDSIIYDYNELGDLSETTTYHNIQPENPAQKSQLEALGFQTSPLITLHKYYYKEGRKKIIEKEFDNGELSYQINFSYDSQDRIVKEQKINFNSSPLNNTTKTYDYDTLDRLINIKLNHPADKKVDQTIFFYDSYGKKLKEERKSTWTNYIITYEYNKNNQLVESIRTGTNIFSSKENKQRDQYHYDDHENLIEYLQFDNDKLKTWVKYIYNKNNLITDELWMNEKDGSVDTHFIFLYSYYKVYKMK